MKARIIFYCVVIAVLLATLAAIPSHATERRDPLLNQEAAEPSGSGHADSTAKLAPNGNHGKKPSPAHVAHAQGGVNPLSEARNKSAAKKGDSSSNKSTR